MGDSIMAKQILFLTGSPNQTSQMHQIAAQLQDYDCYFSQFFSDHPIVKWVVDKGWLNTTVLAGEFRKMAENYFDQHGLKNDYAMSIYNNRYDLVVACSDLLIPRKLKSYKTVWVQEGMTDPISSWGKWSRRLGLPAYMAMNTAFNGASDSCDIYCAASHGYKAQFARLGTQREKICVTGIPNYDNAESLLDNDFPHRDYVLVATSDIRETFRKDDRPSFIKACVKIAAGRPLIFKLHPNENRERATAEIARFASMDSLVFTEGNTGHMIANCQELITQYSTVVYTGIALGKKVHSYFDVDELERLAPLQNSGTSAQKIAELCRDYIEFPGTRAQFLKTFHSKKMVHA